MLEPIREITAILQAQLRHLGRTQSAVGTGAGKDSQSDYVPFVELSGFWLTKTPPGIESHSIAG